MRKSKKKIFLYVYKVLIPSVDDNDLIEDE